TTAPSATAAVTPATPAATNTPGATNTAAATGTAIATNTAPASNTPAATNTAAATNTNTPAATNTAAATSTAPATNTATRTLTVTATRTATGTPTPTATVGVSCPLTSGIYTTTQLTGGTLDVYSFAPFPFPSGGMIVQHVGAGDVNCVHNTVVPFPGGFSSPNFCVPALMFTTSVTQTGCGVGRIDSNGGSGFTSNH